MLIPSLAVSRDSLLRFLHHAGVRRVLSYGRRNARRKPEPKLEKVPNEAGRELMENGTFGHNERSMHHVNTKRDLAYRILERQAGGMSWGKEKAMDSLMKHVRDLSIAYCLGTC